MSPVLATLVVLMQGIRIVEAGELESYQGEGLGETERRL